MPTLLPVSRIDTYVYVHVRACMHVRVYILVHLCSERDGIWIPESKISSLHPGERKEGHSQPHGSATLKLLAERGHTLRQGFMRLLWER